MADRIGLKVELQDKGALKQLKEILAIVKELDGKRIKIGADLGDLQKIEKSLKEIKGALDTITNKRSLQIDSGTLDNANRSILELNDNLDRVGREREARVHINTSQARSELDSLESRALTLRDILNNLGSNIGNVGDALSGWGMAGGKTFGSLRAWATKGLASYIWGNNEATTSRFDILNTYSDYMGIMGYSADKADASLQKLNESIQGLPIGLDEGAYDIKKYSMYLGDIGKATDLAIGLDKALIAGGAPEQMRTQTRYEIERLLVSGKLSRANQYMSLLNGLGVSAQILANQFGYDSAKELANELYSGDADTEKFIEKLIGLGDDKQINEMIDIYKTTFESGMSNIAFAITRGKANILKAINETLETNTGKNISDYLYDVRDAINDLFASAETWVREHPEVLEQAIQMVKDLFTSLKAFDFGSFATAVFGSVKTLFNIINSIYKILPKWAIRGLVTFWMVWASPLGKVMSAIGTVFSIISRFPPIQGAMFRRIVTGMNGMGNVVQSMGKFKTSLKGIGTGFLGASAFIGIIAEIGAVIYEFTKVAETIAQAKLEGFWKNFGSVSAFTGIITGIAGAMVTIFSALGSTLVGGAVVGIGELLTAGFVGIIAQFGKAMKVLVSLANDIADAEFPTTTKIRDLGKVFSELSGAASNIHVEATRNQLSKMDSTLELAGKISDSLPKLEKIANTNVDTEAVGKNLKEIMGAFDVIDDESKDAGWLKKWKSGNQLSVIQNTVQAIEQISSVIETLDNIRTSKMFKRQKGGRVGLEDAIYRVKSIITQINGLLKDFEEGDETLMLQKYDVKSSKNWGAILENTKTAIDSIQQIISALDNMDFGNLMGSDYGTGAHLPALMENIRTVISQLSGLASDIDKETNVRGDSNGQNVFNNLASKMTQLVETLTQVDEAVGLLYGMKDKIATLTTDGIGLDKLFSQLQTEFGGEDANVIGLSIQVTILAGALDQMVTALNTLGEVDISGFTTKLDEAISMLKTFRKMLQNVTKSFDNVATSADDASTHITNMATTAMTQAFMLAPLIGAIRRLASNLSSAASNANSLTTAINNIPTYKQVTVNYNQRRTSGVLGGLLGRFFAEGGSVEYLAKGGLPMRPRGTDTVPAMLTPGEFVMRRQAVSTFGKRFMEQLNSLNISGAFQELTRGLVPSTGYIDNSRHYDNHAVVNQTIHSRDTSHAYRRANRFVNAL